jgi:hypothetical protein
MIWVLLYFVGECTENNGNCRSTAQRAKLALELRFSLIKESNLTNGATCPKRLYKYLKWCTP